MYPCHLLLCCLSVRAILATPLFSQNELTPLHMAADCGHVEVAKALMAAGANVDATNNVSDEVFIF